MSDSLDVMKYCVHCKVRIPSSVCPRCDTITEELPRKEHRRGRHGREDNYLLHEYHVSEDLWRIRSSERRAQIGYSEE